ncbi:hypothetical protein [Micromonospora sp. WMMD1082]|uniref:hypothetical protein n=1 Tax=Micromonospora sp. WMMD1082 TaxID=3016104 RepID=UPI0024165C48|nr:hypothetical protein [Micromonospora sp. WMMD1082]MDG4796181.1 hypothetical protein [Micromonospora sp. WMMD1082]
MSLIRDLLDGVLLAVPIAGGLLLVALATRTPSAAGRHDVAIYHEPTTPDPGPAAEPEPEPEPGPEPDRAAVVAALVAAAPFDPSTVPWRPPYAELELAKVLRRYGDSPEDIARRWLRDIAAGERTAVTV